ncbi:PrgI family protein [Candidatus Saccharibacteria bacterium]|nr:PrgI family protein [Candidatus Saccharibacteria bacterium]
MAQYKVPQDVEADDKLLGPFSFRQFVYLMIGGALIALAVALFQIFPLLAIIPLPFVLFFGALALPLKKDQPMETYLAAIVSYYLKPRNRIWTPGQRESTINITAPKIVEESRTRDITGEEATHRLSFLADIVDTEGYAIRGIDSTSGMGELVAEANSTNDMFETNHFDRLEDTIAKDENERHEEVMKEMRSAIKKSEEFRTDDGEPMIRKKFETEEHNIVKDEMKNDVVVPVSNATPVATNTVDTGSNTTVNAIENIVEKPAEKANENHENRQNASIIELASNPDFSVATIAKEANRIKEKEGEVFISLR